MLSLRKFDSKKLYLIGLGCDHHFSIFQATPEKYANEKSFWVYDKAKLDIAFFLASHSQKMKNLTYITSEHFETIEIKEKPESLKTPQKDKVFDFIQNYEYSIIDGHSSPHPFKAYALICRYMNTQADKQLKSLFRLSFSQHQLSLKQSFIPKLDEIRNKYLKTSGLKLRVLERIKSATNQEIQKNVTDWKKHFQINEIMSKIVYTKNKETQNLKQNWIAENRFGWEVDRSFIASGFGRKFSSIAFK